MKKLSFMAVLAVSTMLTACSSGGSGGGSSFVPTTSLPNGSTIPESGTNIQTVNNTEKRATTYEKAATSAGITTEASAEEINNAYNNMKKILVDQDFSNATEDDILLSLAMAGEDIEGLKDKPLDELKTIAQNSGIREKAEDVYAKLGTERDLSLKEVTFYGPDYALNKAAGAIYNFIIDKDGNLTGLQEKDDGGASVMKFNRVGNGEYQNNEGFVNYGFVYNGEYGRKYEEKVTFAKSTSVEDVKTSLKTAVKAHWGNESEETVNAILAFIDTLDLTNGLIDEDVCETQGNCAYKDINIDTVTVQLNNMGKDTGLKYADFGTVTYNITAGNETGKDIGLFYGGYDALSAQAKDLPQINTEMNFEGKALAQVETEINDNDVSKLYNGTANLTFKDGKETLVADFTDWHKVTLETNKSAYSGYDISVSGTAKDTAYTLENPYLAGADIKYYGENPKNPDEVVGSATFQGDNRVEAEMVFGGTRK